MNTSLAMKGGQSPRRMLAVLAVVGSLSVLAGCAHQSASSSVYTYGQAQREQIVRLGTVEAVRNVVIQNDRTSGGGTLAGAALGGVAGSAIGGGRGQILATIGGGLLGAMAGDKVEHQMGKASGLEITVRLDNGETRVIAQEADVPFSVGQRVRVVSGGGPTRVTPM
ncbi:MAG TPA: glycine zipper 2TM domain-containing protein [Burkholderiaceae bacterium]|nr:glycine zipper 2TM domain-containing protein [Burkholderiaceae bacterium]